MVLQYTTQPVFPIVPDLVSGSAPLHSRIGVLSGIPVLEKGRGAETWVWDFGGPGLVAAASRVDGGVVHWYQSVSMLTWNFQGLGRSGQTLKCQFLSDHRNRGCIMDLPVYSGKLNEGECIDGYQNNDGRHRHIIDLL